MKTTIYELLGMIKDGKTPKKILFKEQIYEYTRTGYYDSDNGETLFDTYYIDEILNDEVTILETTITLNNSFNYLQKLTEDEIPDKKDKLKATLNCIKDSETILGGEYYVIHSDFIVALEEELDKINEIIEVINEKCIR